MLVVTQEFFFVVIFADEEDLEFLTILIHLLIELRELRSEISAWTAPQGTKVQPNEIEILQGAFINCGILFQEGCAEKREHLL
jgi:hypothetical protein